MLEILDIIISFLFVFCFINLHKRIVKNKSNSKKLYIDLFIRIANLERDLKKLKKKKKK